jgi:hypothetical protein
MIRAIERAIRETIEEAARRCDDVAASTRDLWQRFPDMGYLSGEIATAERCAERIRAMLEPQGTRE